METQVRGRDVLDGSICRSDLNVLTSGQAVIRRILEVANSGIKVTNDSTGADAGTGDVKLALDWTLLDSRWATSAWAKNALKPTYTTTEVTEGTNLYYTDT